jgi:caa(3)-type oxidase subunit IV
MISSRSLHLTFAACLLLLLLTTAVAFVDLGAWGLVVNLTISGMKALLIGMIFMELKGDKGLSFFVVVLSFLWPLVLFGFTFADYLSR